MHLHGEIRQTQYRIPLTGTERYPNIRSILGECIADALLKSNTRKALAIKEGNNLRQKADFEIAGEAVELIAVLMSIRADSQITNLPNNGGRI